MNCIFKEPLKLLITGFNAFLNLENANCDLKLF